MRLLKLITFIAISILLSFLVSQPLYASISTYRLLLTIGGTNGSADGELSYPNAVTVDSSGYIYVADSDNNRIQRFDSSGNFIDKKGGLSSSTDDGLFDGPYGVAVDNSGNIYTVEYFNHRIQKFDDSFNFIWKVGGTSSGHTNTTFKNPKGIAIDLDGNIIVADTGNSRIMKFDSNGNYLMKFGKQGSENGELYEPIGIAIDSSNNIIVADSRNNRIQTFTENGVYISKISSTGSSFTEMDTTSGVAIGLDGDYYIADTNNGYIKRFKPNGTLVYSISASSVRQIHIDSTGNLYAANYTNHSIKKFDNGGTDYQIQNLSNDLDIQRDSDYLSIRNLSLWGVNNATQGLRLKDTNGLTLSEITADITADRDWVNVQGDSDQSLGKSVISNLTSAPGASATHTLYVPIPQGRVSSSVYICPDATALNEVSESCTNGVSRSAGSFVESFGNITISLVSNLGDYREYWKIEGITGSGGISQGFTAYSGSGSGTVESPYLILNCNQLQEINTNRGAVYQLANDIDCNETSTWNSGNGFIPIGSELLPFTGKLIGAANIEIDGLTMVVTAENTGLFASTYNATIDNIHLTDVNITKGLNYFGNIGSLVGLMITGEITDSSVTGAITQTVNDWYDTVNVGGMVAVIDDGEINNCFTNVAITFIQYGAYDVGGLVGLAKGNSIINDSYSIGDINTGHDSYYIGGFIGQTQGNSVVNRCYTTGDVHVGVDSAINEGDNYDIGGFIGGVSGSSSEIGLSVINDSFSTGNLTVDGSSNYDVGGFVGTVYDGGNVNNSYATGTVTANGVGNNAVGGFAGLNRQRYVSSQPIITNSYSTGDLSVGLEAYNVGGFIGEHRDGRITDSFTTTDLAIQTGATMADYASNFGGFAGSMSSAVLTDSYATGNVIGNGDVEIVGGFVGWTFGAADIQRCASFGDVNVADYAGGFVGFTRFYTSPGEYASFLDSYTRSDVSVYGSTDYYSQTVGGFVGSSDQSHFENTYATGLVTYDLNSLTYDPYVNIGGFLGYEDVTTVVTNSYWDNQTSGLATSILGTGKITSLMKTQSSFTNWDFNNIWNIDNNVNNGYPFLDFQKVGLIDIDLSSGIITGFNPSVFTYTLNTTDLTEINFNLNVVNKLITGITINGIPVTSGVVSPNFSLSEGNNVFTIVINSIVAPGVSSLSSYTYTITINNSSAPVTPPVVVVDTIKPTVVDTNDNTVKKPTESKPDETPVLPPVIDEEPTQEKPTTNPIIEKKSLSPEAKVGSAFLALLLVEALSTQLGIIKGNIWYALIALFDKLKNRKPWGIVYDSNTKKSLSRSIIRLFDQIDGKLIDTVVSDGLGIFKLAVKEGLYKLQVTKFGYLFPTKTIITNIDGNYSNVYRGGDIEIDNETNQLMIAIPVDPENGQMFKAFLKTSINLLEKFIEIISPVIIITGFIYSLYLYNQHPVIWNLIACYVYGLVLLVKAIVYILNTKEFGKVLDSKRKPIANLELGLYDMEFDKLVAKTVTNEKGKYNFVVSNDNYRIKTLDNRYQINSGEKVILKKKDLMVRLINVDLKAHSKYD